MLIFDSSYLLHRMTHVPALLNIANGCVYGALNSMRMVINNYHPKYVVSVFDSGRSLRRQSIYKDYKTDRDPTTKEEIEEKNNYFDIYNDQMIKIRKFCDHLGIHTIRLDHAEGDDIIDYVSIGYNGKSVIVTDDMDMMTMVNKNRSVYRPMANVEVNHDNFYEYTKLMSPRRYLWFKSILGDKSDNITGLSGVGKMTATVVANSMRSFSPESLKSACNSQSGKQFVSLTNEFDLIQRNLSLMDTSYESFTTNDMVSFNNSFHSFNRVNEISVTKLLVEYDFNSILDRMPPWLLPFYKLESFWKNWNTL